MDTPKQKLIDSTILMQHQSDEIQTVAAAIDPQKLELPKHYELVKSIGQGGMGVIFHARNRITNFDCAIKVLNPQIAATEEFAKRFVAEAKAACTLDHPNVVRFLDFGISGAGHPYFVMEYIGGKSLAQLIEQEGCLTADELTEVFQQICNGLAHAHSRGIIHRDIKPSNIMVCRNDEGKLIVKIVDFGLAKWLSPDASVKDLTQTGAVLGTPAYMSPEQVRGTNPDQRSDLYSLGCVMFHALTGQPPFASDSTYQTIFKQISELPPEPHKLRPDLSIPSAIEQIVLKMLEKSPEQRYQSMMELHDDLEQFRQTGTVRVSKVRQAISRNWKMISLFFYILLGFVSSMLFVSLFEYLQYALRQ